MCEIHTWLGWRGAEDLSINAGWNGDELAPQLRRVRPPVRARLPVHAVCHFPFPALQSGIVHK